MGAYGFVTKHKRGSTFRVLTMSTLADPPKNPTIFRAVACKVQFDAELPPHPRAEPGITMERQGIV